MTASSTDVDAAEDVNDFLLRIRELGEKRDKEDEARTKKLEEDILQGRKERQARRAERARSISPTKDSPVSDAARLSTSSLNQRAIDPPENLEPTIPASDFDTSCGSNHAQENETPATDPGRRDSKPSETDMDTSPRQTPTPLRSRAGTLSWQQRPSSRDLNNNPPSNSGSPTRASHLRSMSTLSGDQSPTRDAFAPSLSSKDTLLASQSTAREPDPLGQRKSFDATSGPTLDANASQKFTGMNREYTTEPEKPIGDPDKGDEQRSWSPSRPTSTIGDSSLSHRYSTVSSVSTAPGLGSPVPLSSAQKLEPRAAAPAAEEQTSTPPSPRRTSPERSTSPTKGLGGFVQSAMLKRSDSVSKRWSNQMPSGLSGISRTNSVASNRNSFASPTRSEFPATPTGSKLGRESQPASPSRPNSSHSEATVLQQAKELERPTTPPTLASGNSARTDESPSRKPLSLHTRSSSALGGEDQNAGSNSGTPLPSRTMDSKRWSPTKASWLESALNRPDTPRHSKQPSQQSPWSRERQSRGSVDLGRRGSLMDVTPPVGLMRSTAPGGHYKKPSVSGIPDLSSGPEASKATEKAPEPVPQGGPEPIKEAASETTRETGPEPIFEAKDDKAKENALPPMESITHSPSPPIEKLPQQDPVPDTTVKDDAKDNPSALAPNSPSPRSSTPQEPTASKPRQSPMVDFRGNLRRREAPKENSQKDEPEFKNVFGKLKRTQTSNYVASDELKDNILRGKAALNVTGGPKKTQRVDEFKESLVKQKEAMKSGGGSLRRNTAGDSDAPGKPAVPIPEAIAKRNNMGSSSSGRDGRSPDALSSPSPKEPGTPQLPRENQPSPLPPFTNEEPPGPESPRPASKGEQGPEQSESLNVDTVSLDNGKTDDGKGVDLEEKLDEGTVESKTGDPGEEAINPVRALPSDNAKAANAPAAAEGPPAKGKLAGRINPALAGMLSRGPPAAASEGPKKPSLAGAKGESTSEAPKDTSTGRLTHMTKSRARGPKRRLPKPAAVKSTPPAGAGESGPPSPPTESFDLKQPEMQPETQLEMQPEMQPSSSVDKPSNSSLRDSQKATPAIEETTPEQGPSPVSEEPTEPEKTLGNSVHAKPREETSGDSPPADLDRNVQAGDEAVERAAEQQEKSSPIEPAVPPKPISPPSRLPPSPSPLKANHEDGILSPVDAGKPTASKFGVGGPRDMPLRGKSLPLPPDTPESPLDKRSSQPPSPPTPSSSLISDPATSKEVISSFFKSFPSSSASVDIDPQTALTNGSHDPKTRTLKKQMWEITGDAKRQDLPMNQEYILYEGSMYLCVHVFEIEGSTRTEVQLWCGDDVPEAVIDDVQGFARKVAKENGCKLELLKQGKETARFIQALGGILITRRGFNSRSSSSALYMLCGRKHLGQMVFDEVDLSRRNLCTGYPFVISAPFGKLYLWKGKGSGAEEIGAARLIGMDLGLTGEIEEVSEGEEPESFFENFPDYKGGGDYVCSEYWQLKPNHAHFRTRLLRIDHELGQRSGFWMRRPGTSSPVIRPNDTLQEIMPFSHKDLKSKDIFVLDIFFEIYVIVGGQASQRSAEFASAVVLAHEYGILAASLQDRPFIPKTFVSIGGLPDSCRSVFRKWNKRSWQPPLRVLTLNAAIEAIRS
ncbi:gelsolin repeat protein [Aspergillus sp. HF37]|nr:gelsolin repeat protein [Aspergillus sp. HF37]